MKTFCGRNALQLTLFVIATWSAQNTSREKNAETTKTF